MQSRPQSEKNHLQKDHLSKYIENLKIIKKHKKEFPGSLDLVMKTQKKVEIYKKNKTLAASSMGYKNKYEEVKKS